MNNSKTSLFDPEIVNEELGLILQNEISLGRWIFSALTLLLVKGESCNLDEHILIEELGFSYIPDIYLENGCNALQLKGKTIIEIKNNLLLDMEIRQTEVYRQLVDNGIVDNLLIVYINPDNLNPINSIFKRRATFINATEFINKLKKAIDAGNGEINKTLKRRTKKQQKNKWKDIRENRLAKAINDFKQFNSVIFVGAGVSSSAKIPDWSSLLKSLLEGGKTITSSDYDNVFKEMDYSNLVTARYIQKILNADRITLINRIRKLLYPSSYLKKPRLISTICELIEKQKNLRSVITYNYDTLIEDNLKKRGIHCFSVYKNNRDDSNSFPIYHVHGVIFRNNVSGMPEEIVLTEDDYHRVYTEVFDWSNVEQLHALTRCTCFFIGLSMKDPNLRRLLEVAQKDSGKAVRHYVFMERKSFSDDSEGCEKDFQIRENILADLGLNVIWYKGNDNHKELPILLKRFAE